VSGYTDYSLFLCNSGAGANENAIKLASFHTGKSKLLAFKAAFHGRTSGAVAATDNPKIVAPFNRTENVEFVALGDTQAVEAKLATGEFCAVIIEGIQGVAGIHCPTDEFFVALRELTKKYGVVLIADEIQSGYGRSGDFFAHQHSKIQADVITVAKGIANGFPMGGVLIAPHIEAKHGMLGTTFGGNHLACAAAIAVLEVIENENLVKNAHEVGEYLIAELKKIPQIVEVRGRGLMIGIEIDGSASEMRKKLLFEHHIFTGGAGATTVRLLPALTITKQQADIFLASFKQLI
jgi:acetylornithine aminotransferase